MSEPRMAHDRDTGSRWLWATFACVLGAGAVYLLWRGRGNTFFYDEWTWIETRRNGLAAVLNSYNAHLLALPIGIYQLLFHTVGLAHYTFYRALAAASHLLCAAAVFEFVRRRLGWVALPVGVVIVFFGSGWEFPLEGVNFGFTASIAFGVAALLALERGDRAGDLWACALLVVGLACSEFCALFALGATVELWLRERSLRRLWAGVLPLACFGLWWLAYYEPYLPHHDLGAVPRFGTDLASAAAGGLLGRGLNSGHVALAVIAVLVVWRVVREGAWSPRLAGLLVTALAFWLLVAYGRSQLGQPASARYVYTGAVLLVLILAEAFRDARLRPVGVAVVGLLCAFSLVGNLNAFADGERDLGGAARTLKAELGAFQLARGIAPADFTLDPQLAPQIIAGQYLAAVRDLGLPRIDTPEQLGASADDVRIAADSVLVRAGEVQLTRETLSRGHVPRVDATLGGRLTRSGRCLSFVPAGSPGAVVELALTGHGVVVAPSGGPPLAIRLRRFASAYPPAAFRTVPSTRAFAVQGAPDAWAAPWHVRISTRRPLRVCAAD